MRCAIASVGTAARRPGRESAPMTKGRGVDANRRAFLLLCTVAGGGVLAGCVDANRQQLSGEPSALPAGQVALNGWVRLSTDGTVIVVVATLIILLTAVFA